MAKYYINTRGQGETEISEADFYFLHCRLTQDNSLVSSQKEFTHGNGKYEYKDIITEFKDKQGNVEIVFTLRCDVL